VRVNSIHGVRKAMFVPEYAATHFVLAGLVSGLDIRRKVLLLCSIIKV
jgi:hypothetical protein